MTNSRDGRAPAVVLDTNAALDWLVFADPSMAAPGNRILVGAWRWLACRRMRDELADVLARAPFAERRQITERALTSFDDLVDSVEPSATPELPPGLRCADPDDQVFVDLAFQQRARWLFTRDKALLALAPAARRHGLEIVAPARWRAEAVAG
jgi:uncharacterized protein